MNLKVSRVLSIAGRQLEWGLKLGALGAVVGWIAGYVYTLATWENPFGDKHWEATFRALAWAVGGAACGAVAGLVAATVRRSVPAPSRDKSDSRPQT